jgi:hypothetical protein
VVFSNLRDRERQRNGLEKEGIAMISTIIEFLVTSPFIINLLLLFLIILDVVLSVLALLLPNTWFKLFHDQPYVDPQGLLRRTGAVWVAFTLLQFIAYMKWQEQPYWLVLIAGVRLTELFSDWTYLYFAQNITKVGRLSLLIAPPANLVMGWFFIQSFLKLTAGK